ncbi:MAG: phosphoribosyltransferase, partial [Candidatus Cryptobacteroides sp.]
YVGTSSTGEVRQTMPLTSSLKGRRVIIAEDIIDTGLTLVALKKILEDEGASQVKVCTMLFKKDAYRVDEKIDYVGKEIPNRFILGFGLDYNELGRNLKDIYVLED